LEALMRHAAFRPCTCASAAGRNAGDADNPKSQCRPSLWAIRRLRFVGTSLGHFPNSALILLCLALTCSLRKPHRGILFLTGTEQRIDLQDWVAYRQTRRTSVTNRLTRQQKAPVFRRQT